MTLSNAVLRNPVAALKVCGAALVIGYALYAHMRIGSLENDLVTERAEKALLAASNADLSAAVDTQNQRVTELQNQAAVRAQAAQEALAAAAGEVGALQDQIDDIQAAQGSSCEDADNLINRAFGL